MDPHRVHMRLVSPPPAEEDTLRHDRDDGTDRDPRSATDHPAGSGRTPPLDGSPDWRARRRRARAAGATAVAVDLVAVVVALALAEAFELGPVAAAVALVGVVATARPLTAATLGHLRRDGHLRELALVVGDGPSAERVTERLRQHPELGLDVVGLVADRATDPVVVDLRAGRPLVTWLGATDDVLDVARDRGATTALVCPDRLDPEELDALVHRLTRHGLRVEVLTGVSGVGRWRSGVQTVGGLGTLTVEPAPRHTWREPLKRAIDVVVSAVALVLTAPVVAAAMVAVRLDSGPGTLFRQVRVGRDGTSFTLLKLRTMVPDAEARLAELTAHNEAAGPMFKMRDDPRVTRVGRVLRATSVDELPQLWNVLRGDMSLVGPRPALPREAAQWDDGLRERLRVRPGITGPWQVEGRFTASLDDYERLDVDYVDNWTLTGDLRLLARTLPAVLGRRGAV